MTHVTRLEVISKVFATLLIVLAGAMMVVIAKGFPWAAIDYWPWPLVAFFFGFGKLTEQGTIIVFGSIFMMIGAFIIAV